MDRPPCYHGVSQFLHLPVTKRQQQSKQVGSSLSLSLWRGGVNPLALSLSLLLPCWSLLLLLRMILVFLSLCRNKLPLSLSPSTEDGRMLLRPTDASDH